VGASELASVYGNSAAVTHVLATRITAQTIPTATDEILKFATEVQDTLGEHNTTTGVVTVAESGYYDVAATAMFSAAAWTAGQYAYLAIVANGTYYRSDLWQAPATATLIASCEATLLGVYLAAGQTVHVAAHHNRGSNTDIAGLAAASHFSVNRRR
jgi:hypothetical protein